MPTNVYVRVTDSAFYLPFEVTRDVLHEKPETFYNAAVLMV